MPLLPVSGLFKHSALTQRPNFHDSKVAGLFNVLSFVLNGAWQLPSVQERTWPLYLSCWNESSWALSSFGNPAAELHSGGGCKLGTMVNGNFPSYHPSDVSQPWPGETTTMLTLAFCLEAFPLVELHSSNTGYARADPAPGVSWQKKPQVLATLSS